MCRKGGGVPGRQFRIEGDIFLRPDCKSNFPAEEKSGFLPHGTIALQQTRVTYQKVVDFLRKCLQLAKLTAAFLIYAPLPAYPHSILLSYIVRT